MPSAVLEQTPSATRQLSSMMQWISIGEKSNMDDIVISEASRLSSQKTGLPATEGSERKRKQITLFPSFIGNEFCATVKSVYTKRRSQTA